MLIDGKKISQEIGENLKKEIEGKNIKPSLGILCVGQDKASLSFINVKKKFGEKFGFSVNILNLSEDVEVMEIKNTLLNLQKENDGVILQLPLPEKFKSFTSEILQVIEKNKDVDDLNEGNFKAPIVLALNQIMEHVEHVDTALNLHDLKFGIIGLGQVVGMPIKTFLENNNYKIEIIKENEHEKIKDCDVVISAVGIPKLIKSEFIKEGALLIDYGCSYFKNEDGTETMCGDFEQECFEKAKFYTPVPGCMGPLVVACLFENVLNSKKINI